MAHYLYSHNLTKGKYIEYILDTFHTPIDKLRLELKELENSQNNTLKNYLFDTSCTREFTIKQKLIENANFSFLLKNLKKNLNQYFKNKICFVHPFNSKIYYESLRDKDLEEYYKYHFADLDDNIKFMTYNNIK